MVLVAVAVERKEAVQTDEVFTVAHLVTVVVAVCMFRRSNLLKLLSYLPMLWQWM